MFGGNPGTRRYRYIYMRWYDGHFTWAVSFGMGYCRTNNSHGVDFCRRWPGLVSSSLMVMEATGDLE